MSDDGRTDKGKVLPATGKSVVASPRPSLEPESDLYEKQREEAEARFYDSPLEAQRIALARHKFPRKDTGPVAEDDEQPVRRRIAGFRLGFEKIFKTTSIRLPCSAYTVYAEMRSSHTNEVFCRCFNGLHTIYDLKKWIYEKLLLPMNAYELSYAESGKVQLTDNMRLLTTQDSLDARSMATMRTVHDMSGNIPGVHSIGDIGVTRLYVRLKCRTCGDLLNSFSTCRKKKQMGHIEPAMNGRKPSEFSRPSSSGSPQNIQLRGRAGGRPHISGPPKPDAEVLTYLGPDVIQDLESDWRRRQGRCVGSSREGLDLRTASRAAGHRCCCQGAETGGRPAALRAGLWQRAEQWLG